ncbi:MAG: hypothetical protein GYA51_18960 [Candidatus Methanofastidiosa archaeon]|nr:hypothetical protein [Candidatus Methanofastidiosa archaeon]
MKCLFLAARRYSITKSVINGFTGNNVEIKIIDFEDYFNNSVNSFIQKYESLPKKIKQFWKGQYVNIINRNYLKDFEDFKPDLVFIYNNRNILPSTLEHFKKTSKIAFILVDNPLYTPTNIYNLHILFYADYIISPDSFWCDQLKMMGITNVHFDCFGFDPEVFSPIKVEESEFLKYQSDIVYIGTAHKNNWGYKRFMFLNQFKNMNIRMFIGGNGYQLHWKKFFPELEAKIIRHEKFDPKFNNLVYNCSKISPVEQVPSLFYGIHIRIFDILGAGIFPLCEYSRDVEKVFEGLDVPFIRHYGEAENLAKELIHNEKYRHDIIFKMRDIVLQKFSAVSVINRLIENISD